MVENYRFGCTIDQFCARRRGTSTVVPHHITLRCTSKLPTASSKSGYDDSNHYRHIEITKFLKLARLHSHAGSASLLNLASRGVCLEFEQKPSLQECEHIFAVGGSVEEASCFLVTLHKPDLRKPTRPRHPARVAIQAIP